MAERLVYIDVTTESIVILCAECAHWSGFAWSRVEAWQRAVAHEEAVHPESTRARKALHAAEKAANARN